MNLVNNFWFVLGCILVTASANNTAGNSLCDNTPITPQICGGQPCYHGNCTIWTRPGGVHSERCSCYRGWLYPHCQKCCDLPCKQGRCIGNSDKTLSCQCEETHTGYLCDVELCLKECINGECEFENGSSGAQHCVCKEGFIGDVCQHPDPNMLPDWYWPIVGFVISLGIILVILVVVIPYVMWKQRAVIILKIHYFFKQYKDDDSLRFDAFIACTSDNTGEDMDFLLETLCPKLEDSLGYKICFGERNFTHGMSLIDNTCAAVATSRRTILLLSPAFIEDSWPMFQVQIAQHESLRSAHRIIPIIYRDLGPVSNQTLQYILSSIQCLRWPQKESEKQQEKFWRKLQVLMPKLKETSLTKQSQSRIEFVL